VSTEHGAIRRRIVVGVDGSESSIDALRWAQRIGAGIGGEIDAVAAWNYPTTYGMAGWSDDWDPATHAARLLADTLTSTFGDTPPTGLRTSVVGGHPAHVLLDASVGAELLVVGSRGHGGFVGLLIGATSAYCAEHAACAVLIAHTKS
jgi:nucleotide-binding universal stress UspA family protein